MRRCHLGYWAVIGAALLCFSACASQGDQELRLAEDLGRAHADMAWQAARAAELEARLKHLEQRLAEMPAQSAPDHEILSRLDQLIAENERQLALRPAPPAAAASPTVADPGTPPGASLTRELEGEVTPEDQLRAVVQDMRARLSRSSGPLTREQNAALRLLLRPERQLDSQNPWPKPWY